MGFFNKINNILYMDICKCLIEEAIKIMLVANHASVCSVHSMLGEI